MSVRVYAFVSPAPAGLLDGITGVAGERLALVRAARVAAVVGREPSVRTATRTTLLRQDRLVRTLAARTSAVLPARFGLELPGPTDLRAIMTAQQRGLQDALAVVRGRAQMTVRVARRPGARVSAPRQEPETTGPGRAYLLARVVRPVTAVPDLARPAALWGAIVRAERAERPRDDSLLTIFHLVDRDDVAAYRRLMRKAARAAPQLTMRVSGPFPPYAFAPPL